MKIKSRVILCSDRSAIVVHKPVLYLRSAGQAVYGSFEFGTRCTRPQPQDVRCLRSTGWRHQHKLDSVRCEYTRLKNIDHLNLAVCPPEEEAGSMLIAGPTVWGVGE